MSKADYELLGLDENATEEEINERYRELKAKYNEDRWLEGEAGNEAARMLGKLDAAYTEIKADLRAREKSGAGTLDEVAADIRSGDLVSAQAKLDACNDRGAEWHYLQSVLFFRKNWMNESKKQLEIAIQMDGSNEKYRTAYNKLKEKIEYDKRQAETPHTQQGTYQDQSAGGYDEQQQQMGGGFCEQCATCCACNMLFNCCLNACCGCR